MRQVKKQESAEAAVGGVILAAGKGTRMKSDRPKVVHEILGEPMLWFVHQTMQSLVSRDLLWTVLGYQSDVVLSRIPELEGQVVLQAEQLGTGHALQCSLPDLEGAGCTWCLAVNGDAPLLKAEALSELLQTCREDEAALACMSIQLDDPSGYGRIIRDRDGRFLEIVEDKDLTADQRSQGLQEVNAGVYCLNLQAIKPFLHRLTNDNRQGEYYITQLIDLCVQAGETVSVVCAGSDPSFLGVNSPRELVLCEELLQSRLVEKAQDRGVVIRGAGQVRLGPRVEIQPGAELTGPLEIYGQSSLEAGVRVDSHVWIKDSVLESGAWVRNFSHLEKAHVGRDCQVGPFARLRPEALLKSGAKAGNFVEIKKATLHEKSKVNHLTYIGDAEIGQGANVGAGTITCNYDGRNKHKTTIGRGAFIGSNTALVAPVVVGENALIGAGSTITKDVPDDTLAVSRAKQKNLPWKSDRRE
jgi:bifunctional UDP-N-acetylglucosamine pyrophosphorylase/glucosamine-1-phosphate N-acetyltransferase